MYDSQEIASRIKIQAKTKKIAIKDLLLNCDLGINAISHLAKGQTMAYLSLAKIADCLDCSVDYLLGRANNSNDESEAFKKFNKLSPKFQKFVIEQINNLLKMQETDTIMNQNVAGTHEEYAEKVL